MSLEVIINKKCACGETITEKFHDTRYGTQVYFNNPQKHVKCVCGKKYKLHLDCSIRIIEEPVPNSEYINKVYIFNNSKIVIKESDLPHLMANPELYTFVSDKPHEDGDFSYLCNFNHCKCRN